MSENNEYYADKMRRLLEKQKRNESAPQLTSAGAKVTKEEKHDERKDFSFEENKKKKDKEDTKKEASEEVKDYAKIERKRLKKVMTTVALLIAIFVLGIFCIYKIFFVIRDIGVVGCEKYTEEQVLAAVGAEAGDNLYSFSSRVAADSIRMYCPEIGEVTVKRTPPGKIVITVVEEKAVYYTECYGEIRALTGDLRVLGVINEDMTEKLVHIELPKIQRAVAGQTVRFIGGGDEYVFEVAAAVAEAELSTRLGRVDLSSAHDIILTCDGKYILKLGDHKQTADKLKIAAEVLKDKMFDNDNKATIDLSDVSQTGVVIDNQLVID